MSHMTGPYTSFPPLSHAAGMSKNSSFQNSGKEEASKFSCKYVTFFGIPNLKAEGSDFSYS